MAALAKVLGFSLLRKTTKLGRLVPGLHTLVTHDLPSFHKNHRRRMRGMWGWSN